MSYFPKGWHWWQIRDPKNVSDTFQAFIDRENNVLCIHTYDEKDDYIISEYLDRRQVRKLRTICNRFLD